MFRTVLWATDGSAAAERALAVAKSIAQTYDAKLVVTHVSAIFLGGPPITANSAQETADAIKADLQRQVEDLRRDGLTVEFALPTLTNHGVAYAIAGFAREAGADVIVVGTSGTSRLLRVLVGSVTRRLIELAPCPILAVPPEDEDGQR